MTEQLLRDLLDHDSAGPPPTGVRLADVDARVRGIRGRRLAGSLAAAALTVAAVTTLTLDAVPVRQATPAASGVWGGALAQPSPQRVRPTPPLFHGYTQGGRRETFTFDSDGGKVSFALSCPADGYALIWLNGKLEASGPCGPTIKEPPGWFGSPATTRDGANELTAALVKATDAGTGTMTSARADELLAWTKPYPAGWRLTLLDSRTLSCRADVVRIAPDDGRIQVDC